MPYARKCLVSLRDTEFYHVTSRCVRRSWLCGYDDLSKQDYSHRKTWIIERLSQLASVFAIDICAYAVLSNHYHLVVRVDCNRAIAWSDAEVVTRWTRIFNEPPLIERWRSGEATTAELDEAHKIIDCWRSRLYTLSWFMRSLNEPLARRANAEDDCSGCFWESRFKSQALVDEAGLLTAMAYVDLNPVRAGIAATAEESDFTSISQRVRDYSGSRPDSSAGVPVLPFQDGTGRHGCNRVPYRFEDYRDLLRWTAHSRPGSRPEASELPPRLIQEVGINADTWQRSMQLDGNIFGRAIGRLQSLRKHALTLRQSWIKGLRRAEQLFSATPAAVLN